MEKHHILAESLERYLTREEEQVMVLQGRVYKITHRAMIVFRLFFYIAALVLLCSFLPWLSSLSGLRLELILVVVICISHCVLMRKPHDDAVDALQKICSVAMQRAGHESFSIEKTPPKVDAQSVFIEKKKSIKKTADNRAANVERMKNSLCSCKFAPQAPARVCIPDLPVGKESLPLELAVCCRCWRLQARPQGVFERFAQEGTNENIIKFTRVLIRGAQEAEELRTKDGRVRFFWSVFTAFVAGVVFFFVLL